MSNIDKVSAALSEWIFNVAASILPKVKIPNESPIGKFMYGILGVDPSSYSIWKELGFLAEPTIQVMLSPVLTKFLGAVPNAQMLFDAVKGAGGEPEEKGRFNKWVLFFAMNMIHSDYGGVLSSLANGAEYAKLCYKMALAWILDPDRKHSIRHEYGLEC